LYSLKRFAMYPAVQQQFNTSTSSIQLTLSFAMIGLALGQFIFGPLSEHEAKTNTLRIISAIFFRPNTSDKGPNINCPSARPIIAKNCTNNS
jgi:hypothetical protein